MVDYEHLQQAEFKLLSVVCTE